jgi:hypothetical protein
MKERAGMLGSTTSVRLNAGEVVYDVHRMVLLQGTCRLRYNVHGA